MPTASTIRNAFPAKLPGAELLIITKILPYSQYYGRMSPYCQHMAYVNTHLSLFIYATRAILYMRQAD